jgi:hypothetical protein
LKQLLQGGHISPFYMAVIYAGLERNDQAFEYLEKAYEERSSQMSFLKVDPVFERLRSDARFMTLLRCIGLAS